MIDERAQADARQYLVERDDALAAMEDHKLKRQYRRRGLALLLLSGGLAGAGAIGCAATASFEPTRVMPAVVLGIALATSIVAIGAAIVFATIGAKLLAASRVVTYNWTGYLAQYQKARREAGRPE